MVDGAEASEHRVPGPGPVSATVAWVVDGDTIRIEPLTWPDGKTYVRVRFETISAPEVGARAKCAKEAALAAQAKIFLAGILRPGDAVRLLDGRPGRYPGRLIAKVRSDAGDAIGPFLVRAKLAVPFGTQGRPDWCGGS